MLWTTRSLEQEHWKLLGPQRILAVIANQHRDLSHPAEAVETMERALHESLAAGDERMTIRILGLAAIRRRSSPFVQEDDAPDSMEAEKETSTP